MTTTPAPSIAASLLTGTSTGPFPTGFKYNAAEDVRVWLELAGVQQPDLTVTTDYTLTGATPLVDGGTVTLQAGVVPEDGWDEDAGDRIVIARRTAKRQALALPDTEGHKPRSTEAVLDKLMRIGEEQADQIDLTVRAPAGEAGPTLPPLSVRDGRLAWFSGPSIAALLIPAGHVVAGDAETGDLTTIPAVFAVDSTPAYVASRAATAYASFPASLQFVSTAGYTQPGDGGGGLYAKVEAEPAHFGKFQSADGAWWEYQSDARGVNARAFGANGGTADGTALNRAVAFLPASGGVIYAPDADQYVLDTPVLTGTKKVAFQIGVVGLVIGPPGDHGFVLQSNGSSVEMAGKWAAIYRHRPPASAMVLPTITTTLTGGAVTSVAIGAGGSGMKSCPVAVCANSPAQALTQNPDAGLILTQGGGTVSNVAIVAAGTGYVTAPAVTLLGGGAAAVMIDNVQGCRVKGFSVDFQNVPGSVGVYHRGGWWCHVEDVDVFYDTASGLTSEHSTSIGLLVDSYTLGVPGPTGGYGGSYVSQYSNIHFTRRACIGHDTSTVTTLNFNRCDFKNSYLHACIDIVELGPVKQAAAGFFYDLINVDALTIIGGDLEVTAGWFRFIGSCNNIRAIGTLVYAASGARFRGQAGSGSFFDFAASNSTIEPLRIGSGGNAGDAYQNTGWKRKHRLSLPYDGEAYVLSSNLKLTSASAGVLDDDTVSGMACIIASARFSFRIAYAGVGSVVVSEFAYIDAGGASLPSGGVKVAGTKVLGTQVTGDPGAASDPASTQALSNWLRGLVLAHGLGAT